MTSEIGIVLMIESEVITPCCWAQALLNRGYRVLEDWSSSEAFDVICSYLAGLVSALLLARGLLLGVTATRLARQMTKENPQMRVIAFSTLRGDVRLKEIRGSYKLRIRNNYRVQNESARRSPERLA